jgi:hypothetical protein
MSGTVLGPRGLGVITDRDSRGVVIRWPDGGRTHTTWAHLAESSSLLTRAHPAR